MATSIRTMVPASGVSHSWRTGALLAGIGLAASFLYVRARTRQVERENPPQGKFVEVDGVRLHYIERGQGPALVLLHGNGTIANDFDASGLAERAARHYRVIAFDRPGYGYSARPRTTVWTPRAQARLLYHALQEIGVSSPIVLGHSWGTLTALSMGLDFSGDVRGLILLSGYYYPSLRLDVPLLSPPAIPVIGDLLRYTVSPLLGRLMWPAMVKRIFSPLPVPQRFRQLPVWMMLRPSQLRASAAESALMVPSAMILSRSYRELKVPTTIIAGTDDKIADSDHNSKRLHGDLKHSDLQLQTGVGHMTHYAHPDKVLAEIDALATQVGTRMGLPSVEADRLARASESGL